MSATSEIVSKRLIEGKRCRAGRGRDFWGRFLSKDSLPIAPKLLSSLLEYFESGPVTTTIRASRLEADRAIGLY
jgi:hypothetical protein